MSYRLTQVFEVVEAALQLAPEERSSFLDANCKQESLRKYVDCLLLSYEEAGQFLEEPAIAIYADQLREDNEEACEGRQIGAYRLMEEIGEGGMGSVYRAVRADDQYQKEVAIKFIRTGLDSKSSIVRFKAERQILANLEHPNISRLLDGGTTRDGIPYLVMELVRGRTIDRYCDEQDLPLEDKLTLFCIVCSAVHYAHRNHIVHRDLKPSNILVTRDGVPKLLDFGIAKMLDIDPIARGPEPTASLMRLLTPAYASPEQVRGEVITEASDIYSLGAVLYLLLTGKHPYSIKSASLENAAKIICEFEPPKPSSAISSADSFQETGSRTVTAEKKENKSCERKNEKLRQRLAGDLDNIVLKALRKDPKRRYASVEEFSKDIHRHLNGLPVLARRDTIAYRAGKFIRRNRTLAIGAVILLVIASIGLASIGWQARKIHRMSIASQPEIYMRPSVAVMGFENLSGKPSTAWLSTALSEMITTELAAGEKLRTIPGANIAQTKADLKLAENATYDKGVLPRIHKNLGADFVILGSYFDVGEAPDGKIRLDVNLQSARTGEILTSTSVSGSESQLPELASRIGAHLRSRLGVRETTPTEAAAVQASLPLNSVAARFYAQGLSKLRVFDALAARRLFEKAIAADPRYSMAHAALAAAWADLGYDAKSADEAKRAFDLSSGLSREDRLSVEAAYRETIHEYEKAAELYRTLFSFFPDNLEYGLGLVRVKVLGGKGKTAFSTVDALRKLPLPAREDPRIDLAEAMVAHAVTDYRRMQTAAAIAEQKGRALGTRLVIARALYDEAMALGDIGNPKESIAKAEEARSIYIEAGNRSVAAEVLNQVGNVLADMGDTSKARAAYEEALRISRETGKQVDIAGALGNIALLVADMGDPAGAKKLSEESLDIYRKLGDKRSEADALLNIANNLDQLGDFDAAVSMYRRSAAAAREIGYESAVASALNNTGIILTSEGKMAPARQAFEQALEIHRASGQERATTYPLEGLGDISFATGNLPDATVKLQEALDVIHQTGEKAAEPSVLSDFGDVLYEQNHLVDARNDYQQALESANRAGYKQSANEVRVKLAELALDDAHPAEAETLTREAIGEFQLEKLRDDEITAHSVLTLALLSQRHLDEARIESSLGETLATKTYNQESRLRMSVAAARLQLAEGNLAVAKNMFEAILAQAGRYEFVRYQYQARLALGEIELKTGQTQAGRSILAALQKEASDKGYDLIAKNAGLASRSTGP